MAHPVTHLLKLPSPPGEILSKVIFFETDMTLIRVFRLSTNKVSKIEEHSAAATVKDVNVLQLCYGHSNIKRYMQRQKWGR